MSQKHALITGITGQDGSYLAELLLNKGYKVSGLVRRTSTPNTSRINHILGDINLIEGDLTDQSNLNKIIQLNQFHEVYNCAAQSHVRISFEQPLTTTDITGVGVLRLLEAIRASSFRPKLVQCSTSEMFGKVQETPQTETTPFYPRSPYGCAKLFAHWAVINYRESYNMFACSAIMFNHESERRGDNFVTRKISKAVAAIKLGKQRTLELGNLDAKRDWGYSPDFVQGLYMIMQHHTADEFILATGETHSVQEFLDEAFGHVGLNPKDHVIMNPNFMRPAEVDLLVGNANKAHTILGWRPSVTFNQLVGIMVDSDLKELSK